MFWATALAAIAALLATVAVLQYRWTGEASTAEGMRIGAELESLMMKWHADLYGEVSAVCVAMQVGPDSGARETWNDYMERYVEWSYAQPHEASPNVYRNPDLIQDIYIWETGLAPTPRLFLLNIDKKKIEPSAAPAGLPPLLARLQVNSSTLSAALRAWQFKNQASGELAEPEIGSIQTHSVNNSLAGWQFDMDVPAMVHPIFHRIPGKSLDSESPVDWIIITLDVNILEKRIFPDLASRYFGSLNGLAYRVGVITTGTTPRTIYSSDPGFEKQGDQGFDSTMDIFGPAIEGDSRGKPFHSAKASNWHSFAGPVWFPVFQHGAKPGEWILEVQHRTGPLQTVIDRVRQKNLAVSGFILFLLTLNIAVMTIAGFRAQKFARLQMDFVASVSHELRTPLTAIYSAGENIKDGVVTGKEGLKQYGELILGQARQLGKNVDRILLFASIRSGKTRYSIRPLQVSEILNRVRQDTSALLTENSCTIEQHIEPAVTQVLGDPVAVSSCLENLVTNAIKYSGDEGHIRLTAALEWSDSLGQQVAINVEDHGIGIERSDLKNIFEPFYRSQSAVASQIHGTGLGLSLAKHLAEAMDGSLSVTSEVGVGSIFTLRLPVPLPLVEEPEFAAISSSKNEGDEHE